MSLNGREKQFYTLFIPSGHCHTLNFCMTSSKQCSTLHPSITWLPGGCPFHQHSSPRAVLPATALHHPPLLFVLCLPEEPCTEYSINYDTKGLVMTLFFWVPLCLLCLKETMDRFCPRASLSLHSQAAAVVLCSALWLTCGVTWCVCLCSVGKEHSFKWKKKLYLSFLKCLETVKDNVIFLPAPHWFKEGRKNKTRREHEMTGTMCTGICMVLPQQSYKPLQAVMDKRRDLKKNLKIQLSTMSNIQKLKKFLPAARHDKACEDENPALCTKVIAAFRFTDKSPDCLVPRWWEHSCLGKHKLSSSCIRVACCS